MSDFGMRAGNLTPKIKGVETQPPSSECAK